MRWIKKGIIFNPNGKFNWAINSTLQPTPLLMNDRIRIFFGSRDVNGTSRVGFVDVDAKDPKHVLGYSRHCVLDVGPPGAFDESGVVPSAILKSNEKVYLYYAGYQLGTRVRFMVFGGLAISSDDGQTFTRYKTVPVFERRDNELLFRVPHSVIIEDKKCRVWYGAGSEFTQGDKKTLPVYNIRYQVSKSLTNFYTPGRTCLDISSGEHRLGRPYVFVDDENCLYRMFYSIGTQELPYKLGYAESKDKGLTWRRRDEELNLELSDTGWDSEMMAYPSVTKYQDKVYLFYNGNRYGEDGFGYAELISWR